MQACQLAGLCLEVALESAIEKKTAANTCLPSLQLSCIPVLILAMEEPTASDIFCNRMLSMVNSEDVNAIIQAQRHM